MIRRQSAIKIVPVHAGTAQFAELLAVAERLNQAKYIQVMPAHVDEAILLGAELDGRYVGFLRCFVQVIGREEGRPPVRDATGAPLREGYVEAFGVLPEYRRRGIGRCLQEAAIAHCRARSCYQIRSRSPVTSVENYALKLAMGYAVQPSLANDSYYFIKTLA